MKSIEENEEEVTTGIFPASFQSKGNLELSYKNTALKIFVEFTEIALQ